MQLVAIKEKINVKAIAMAFAITIGFAAAYYLGTIYSPILAKSSLAGMVFGKTLRLANMLRAFSLITPFAAIGTGLGGLAMDLNDAMPNIWNSVFNTIGGLAVFWIAKTTKKSRFRDLTLLAGYGAWSGLVVSISKAGTAAILGIALGVNFMDVLGFKVISSIIVYMCGYALVEGWNYARSFIK